MDKTFTLRQLPSWSQIAASMARITGSVRRLFGKRAPSSSSFVALVLAALLFCGLAIPTAKADFPPALVIDSVLYPAIPVSGTTGLVSYSAANGVLILSGSLGGAATWGVDETTALSNPSLSGTWNNNYAQPILLSGDESVPSPAIIIPQLLLFDYSNGSGLLGYDGWGGVGAIGTCWDSAGRYISAYNGIPDGYIFRFCNDGNSDRSPIYRYQAGASPMLIDTTNGWPGSNVALFPSQIHYNGDTLNVTSFTEGISREDGNGIDINGYWDWNGYWSNVYYDGVKSDGVTHVYGEMHIYIATDGSPGQMWGIMEGAVVNAQWNPDTQIFVWGDPSLTSAGSPSYGPPNLEYNGAVLWFKYKNAQGSDVYCDNQQQTWGFINSSHSITVTSAHDMRSGSYDPASQDIIMGNPWAQPNINVSSVSADGMTLLGGGITVLTSREITYSSLNGSDKVYLLHRPDGKIMYKYTAYDPLLGLPWLCQFKDERGASPIYYTGSIDASNGWPQSNTPSPQALPAQVFAYGVVMNIDNIDGPRCWSTSYYDANNMCYSWACFGCVSYHYSGAGYQMLVCSFSDGNKYYWFGNEGDEAPAWSPDNWSLFLSLPDPNITFSSLSPRYGPPQVAWNGTSAMFSYSDANGADVYNRTPHGGTTSFQVTIDSSSQVAVTGTDINLAGTYSSSTHQFDMNGGTLLAQDVVGNLLGTPSGLVIYSANPWVGIVSLAKGGYGSADSCDWGGSIYKFKRNDGSCGIKFLGIPQGSWFIVQNQAGTVSPYYRYSETSGDFVLNTGANGEWPTSNIWPRQLYVNGHYTALDASSEIALNGGYMLQVSYHVQPEGETITVNWCGNYGVVTGSYGSFGSFSGTWDGGSLFGGLPNGLAITTTPPSYIARYGPPQIKWNGVELVFDPLASAVSGSNPQGLDVYRDSQGLGLSARIGSNGAVTLYQADGSQLTGTYDSGTYQFNFGAQATGSIQADSTQGLVISSGRGTGGEPGTNNATTEAPGNFDIQGNVFSLGSWSDASGNSTPGLMLSFTSGSSNQASVLRFGAVRKTTNWVWSHADTDGSSSQITSMKLDSSNRLQLFDPAVQTTGTTAQPTIVLDPAVSGTSRLQGTVHVSGTILIQPLGDLLMGDFTDGAKPQ